MIMIERALVIKEPYVSNILKGRKTWELRSRSTNIRGTIGLIASRSGTVIGIADLIDVRGPLKRAELARTSRKHGVPAALFKTRQPIGTVMAWVLCNPFRLKRPVPYNHPSGAIIWVRLKPAVSRAIEEQLPAKRRREIVKALQSS